MKLQKYLNEKTKDIYNVNVIIDNIKKECKPYLKEASRVGRRNLLYRGAKGKHSYFEGSVRQHRVPTDMPKHLHDMFNKAFKNKFGINLRSNSLFCYPMAETIPNYMTFYGLTYIIFPVNGFQIIWSYEIDDLYEIINNKHNIHSDHEDNSKYEWAVTKEDFETDNLYESAIIVSLEGQYSDFKRNGAIYKKWEKWRDWKINQIVDTYKISKNKLPKFNKKTEIMLVCDKYHAISVEHAYNSESTILKELGIK